MLKTVNSKKKTQELIEKIEFSQNFISIFKMSLFKYKKILQQSYTIRYLKYLYENTNNYTIQKAFEKKILANKKSLFNKL